ncbi:MAG: iron-containing alcohol dehydrogenase [Pontibacterium sp.]
MSPFVFNAPARIMCAPNAIANIADYCVEINATNPMIVTDAGIVAVGILDQVLSYLADQPLNVAVYDQVQADPAERFVLSATEKAQAHNADVIIGLGGGSSMDVAKLVALLAKGDEQLEDIYGVNQVKGARLPLIQIPTTAGTGSEVTAVSIITVGETEKKGVVSPRLLPDLALLDPQLTVGLPAMITATTGIDAMVHAIEAYTSANVNNNPISQVLAKQALVLLGENISAAVLSPPDIQVRANMLLGAMLAGQAFANSPVAAVHAMAYPLGGIYHLSHGLTNALVLPHVMAFNRSECADAYAELAPLVFPEMSEINDMLDRSQAFIEALALLSVSLGLKPRLRDYDIPEQDLPMLASEAMKQTRLLVNNPRPVTEADVLQIYQAAW